MKPVLVVTHERSGTHLLINIINFKNNGNFSAVGKLPQNIPHNTISYKEYVYKYLIMNSHANFDLVSKSHHQFGFFEEHEDYLFENYKIIYVQREIKDTLLSYYLFLNSDGNKNTIKDFPKLEDWVFMNPKDVGNKYFAKYPDPHVLIEPKDYVDRIILHRAGWMKHKDKLLIINYEDIICNYPAIKIMIETYLGRNISPRIPDINDKNFPNFVPNKGVVGAYKDYMDIELIAKIEKK